MKIQPILLLLLTLLLGSYKGYVALFPVNGAEPIRVYPYPVTSLPHADQAALEQRIPIRSEQELARLLEDYLS